MLLDSGTQNTHLIAHKNKKFRWFKTGLSVAINIYYFILRTYYSLSTYFDSQLSAFQLAVQIDF